MSGPKSSRYQLTPEQRAALAEARRRELARKKGLVTLKRYLNDVIPLCDSLSPFCEKAELLLQRTGEELGFLPSYSDFTETADRLKAAATLAEDATLDEVKAAVAEATPLYEKLKTGAVLLEALGETVSETLNQTLNEAIGAVGESFADLDEKKERLERRIALRRALLSAERDETLPQYVKGKLREALSALSDTDDLKTFESVVFEPVMKAVKEARAFAAEIALEYAALREEYEALCAAAEVTPLPTACTKDGMEMLKRYIKTLSYEIAYDDEESYIGDVLDSVMREMGYHVLAERTVDKKSGKRFSHELYTYHDGTVVNVTTASDGKITMELGKPDRVDRLPSEDETDTLVQEMEAFCRDFAEIEEKLKERGVVVADRIHMLPPTAENAQIINVEEYTFRRETEAEKKSAVSWQTRVNKRRRVFRHIKIK